MDWADTIAGSCVSDGTGDADTRRRIADALRAEREACARIAEEWARREPRLTETAYVPGADHGERYASSGIAARIRNRLEE